MHLWPLRRSIFGCLSFFKLFHIVEAIHAHRRTFRRHLPQGVRRCPSRLYAVSQIKRPSWRQHRTRTFRGPAWYLALSNAADFPPELPISLSRVSYVSAGMPGVAHITREALQMHDKVWEPTFKCHLFMFIHYASAHRKTFRRPLPQDMRRCLCKAIRRELDQTPSWRQRSTRTFHGPAWCLANAAVFPPELPKGISLFGVVCSRRNARRCKRYQSHAKLCNCNDIGVGVYIQKSFFPVHPRCFRSSS